MNVAKRICAVPLVAVAILGCGRRPAQPPASSLKEAVIADDLQAARRLIMAGADVNQKDDTGESLLMLSFSWHSSGTAMTDLLLAHGANVNATSVSGGTALADAVISGREDIVRRLLAYGADVNQRNAALQTPLIMAAIYPRIMDMLLDAGADARAQDKAGYTALTFCRDKRILAKLVARGADVNAEDAYHETLFPAAAAAGDTEMMRFLAKHGARFDHEGIAAQRLLCSSLSCGDDRSLRVLVALGVDINTADSEGNTCLFSVPTPPIAKWFVDAGANFHRRNNAGYTPREWAFEKRRFAVADLLDRYEKGLAHAATPPPAATTLPSSTGPS